MSLAANETLMYREAWSAGDIVARQFAENDDLVRKIAADLLAHPPAMAMTCARGSSDHAASFGKYLIESNLNVMTACAAPSVHSVFGGKPAMKDGLFIGVSQSGASPDLVCSAKGAKEAGARVIAIVNVTESPLAGVADYVIPLHAGPEKSVAATKTFIASLTAIVHLMARWSGDDVMLGALKKLPDQLREAAALDWSAAGEVFQDARNFFVLGRGTGFGVAKEAALKFKETSGLHAEAYSAAEVKHGPMAIVGKDFPVLVFAQNDQSREGTKALVQDFVTRGANVMVTGMACDGAINLPWVRDMHPVLETVAFIQSFYIMVNALSVARGYNPDVPPHLNKVTETM